MEDNFKRGVDILAGVDKVETDKKWLINAIKDRRLTKKRREIEELKLEIEKAKLQKELQEIQK